MLDRSDLQDLKLKFAREGFEESKEERENFDCLNTYLNRAIGKATGLSENQVLKLNSVSELTGRTRHVTIFISGFEF